MYLDVHALQSVPPSNLNRDDTGSPKTALYGGALRARVSSQAWKRAMRLAFQDVLPADQLGVRTKLAVQLIADKIVAARPDLADRADELGSAVLKATGMKIKASTRKGAAEGSSSTDYLVFIAERELEELSSIAISWADEGVDVSKVDKGMKSQISEVFHGKQAVDIALFGRMLADAPDLNTDASCQVAHAISVNRVAQDYDYFTAVDDCAADDNAGAGMIGTVEFNSSTLYRYATVNLDAFSEQLGDPEATAEGAAAFVDVFARSMPTGKQNTFANRTLPSTVLVLLRKDQPVNLVSAFEDPVRQSDGVSISAAAEVRLADEMKRVDDAYGTAPVKAWVVSTNRNPADFGDEVEQTSLGDLVDAVRASVNGIVAPEEA